MIVGTINHHSDQYALSEELGNTRDLIDALSMHPLGLDPFPTCCWVVRRCMHAFPGRNTEFGEQQGAGRPVSVRACGRRMQPHKPNPAGHACSASRKKQDRESQPRSSPIFPLACSDRRPIHHQQIKPPFTGRRLAACRGRATDQTLCRFAGIADRRTCPRRYCRYAGTTSAVPEPRGQGCMTTCTRRGVCVASYKLIIV